MPRVSGKLLVFKAVASAFTILAFLGLFEVILRVIGYNPYRGILGVKVDEAHKIHSIYRESDDKILLFEPNPGYPGAGLESRIHINSSGFRGPEYGVKKDGRFRIIVLGDSLTFGNSLQEHCLFTSRLENRLRTLNPKVDVLNMSAESYDTLQEVFFLRKKGLRFSPDIVIVTFCLNDIGITPPDIHSLNQTIAHRFSWLYHFRFWQWISMRMKKLKLIQEYKRFLRTPSAEAYYGDLFPPAEPDSILTECIESIHRVQEEFDHIPPSLKHHDVVADKLGRLWLNQYTSLKNIGKIRYAFSELRRLSLEKKFEVIVLIVPFFYKVAEHYLEEPAHRIIRHEAERMKFRVLDAYEPLEKAGLANLTLDGVHANREGHRLIAQFLYNKLCRVPRFQVFIRPPVQPY